MMVHDLIQLRTQIAEAQQQLLTTIWQYFRTHHQWMPVRQLHHETKGKQHARPLIEQMGGSIIFERAEQNGTHSYVLTLLGALLTEDGEQYEHLLIDYLAYVYRVALAEPNRTQITSQEIAMDLNLPRESLILLGSLINMDMGTFFARTMAGYGTHEWSAEIAEEIEDVPDDYAAYVRQRTLRQYDPHVPITDIQRHEYLWRKQIAAQLGDAAESGSTGTCNTHNAALLELLTTVEQATTAHEKGLALEALMATLFESIAGFTVRHRKKTTTEEIDLIIVNDSDDPRLRRESAIILAECKNWSKPCGKDELVLFQKKIENRYGRCSLGFFIAWRGFAKTVTHEQLRGSHEDVLIVPVTGADIRRAIQSDSFQLLLTDAWDKAIFT